MKKIVIIMTIVMIGSIAAALCYDTTKIHEPKEIEPIEAFGNQQIHLDSCGTQKDGDWIYTTAGYLEDRVSIVKFGLDNPANIKLIRTIFLDDECWIDNVTEAGGWVYFVLEYHTGPSILYRMKVDGSKMKRLAYNHGDEGLPYILTDKRIYYQKANSFSGPIHIYAMDFDGKHNHQIVNSKSNLVGIDNGWIYYTKDSLDEEYLYRIRPDGTKAEKTWKVADMYGYVVVQDEIFFSHQNYDTNEWRLMKKTIKGKKTVLTTGVSDAFGNINVEGNWVFFSEGNKVYKIKKSGKGGKQLAYRFDEYDKDSAPTILLYDGEMILLYTPKSVYIKRNGTVIDISYTDAY